jgi:hypothetical protein
MAMKILLGQLPLNDFKSFRNFPSAIQNDGLSARMFLKTCGNGCIGAAACELCSKDCEIASL